MFKMEIYYIQCAFEGDGGQVVGGKKANRIGIVARLGRAAEQLGLVEDEDGRAPLLWRIVVNIYQLFDLHTQVCFFQRFAHGDFGGIFTVVDKASGNAPFANFRVHGAAHEQNFAILHNKNTDPNFGIGEMDKAALGAGAAWFVANGTGFHRTAAAAAKLDGFGGKLHNQLVTEVQLFLCNDTASAREKLNFFALRV